MIGHSLVLYALTEDFTRFVNGVIEIIKVLLMVVKRLSVSGIPDLRASLAQFLLCFTRCIRIAVEITMCWNCAIGDQMGWGIDRLVGKGI